MLRFAFSEPSIGSSTTQTCGSSPKRRSPSSSETSVKVWPVVVQPLEQRDDRRLGRGVDRGRVVAAHARADDRLALGPRRQLASTRRTSSTAARQNSSQRSSQPGWKSRPETSLG